MAFLNFKNKYLIKVLRIIWLVTVAVAAVLLACVLLIQTPFVQTFITEQITNSLSDGVIDAEIHIGKVHFKPFTTIVLKNVVVKDIEPFCPDSSYISGPGAEKFRVIGTSPVDTLFSAEYVTVSFSLSGLLSKTGIKIGQAYIGNGGFNLVIEDGEYTTNITRMFKLGHKDKEKKKDDKEIFRVNQVVLEKFRFRMKNYTNADTGTIKSYGIDWNDMDVSDITIRAHDLAMKGKVMSGTMERMSFREKSGYVCNRISGSTAVGNGKTLINNLEIEDPWSRIELDYFNMIYESEAGFSDFINKVKLEASIQNATVNFGTIGYFAPELKDNALILNAKGKAEGPVENLNIEKIEFNMPGENLCGTVSGRLSNVTDGAGMKADLEIRDLHLNTSSLERFINYWSDSPTGLDKFAKDTDFTLNGNIGGQLKDMQVVAALRSEAGNVGANITLSGIGLTGGQLGIKGKLRTINLNLNKILPSIPINECSLQTKAEAKFGGKGGMSVNIDSLFINRLNFNDYDYKNIAAAGELDNNRFNGKVICSDPNLNFMFQGIFTLSSKTNNALYRFYANLGYADLNALNLDKRGMSKISFRTVANFSHINRRDMFGKIEIDGINLENELGIHDIGDIRLNSHSTDNGYGIHFTSSFAEGSYTGSAPIGEFIKDLNYLVTKEEFTALQNEKDPLHSGNRYEVAFKTLNSSDLLSFVFPGLYIAENTTIGITVNNDGLLNCNLYSQRVALRDKYLKDITFKAGNSSGAIKGNLNCGTINIASLKLLNNNLKLFADDNHIGVGFTYDNQGDQNNRGEVFAVCDIQKDEDNKVSYLIGLLPSSIKLNSSMWNIYPSEVVIKGKDIDVKMLDFRSEGQSIQAYGGVSSQKADTLDVNLENFDLSLLSPLLGKDMSIGGTATGSVTVSSPVKENMFSADIACDSLKFGDEKVGNLTLKSNWNKTYSRMEIKAANRLDGITTLDMSGIWYPKMKRIEANAAINGVNVHYAQPFLTDVFSEMNGKVYGRVSVTGSPENLDISGTDTYLENVALKIGYTNVRYIANGPFSIDNHGIHFHSIRLTDRFGNNGTVTGKIGFDRFRNMYFDTGIDVRNIEAINISEKEADVIYGNVSATGHVSITGPLNSILLSADAVTSGAGQLHIPIPSTENAGVHNLLKFKEPAQDTYIDPYELMMSRLKQKDKMSSDFSLKLRVGAGPELEAFIEIDKASGNVLTGRGNGLIDLNLQPAKDIFDIKGDYTISRGNYRFVALGLAERDFSINEGSTVKFNGNVMESTLDINATYRTKASLSTLIADTTSTSRRMVDCGIHITDKLANPRLKFSIDIPDLDPIIKSRVENALSTEDKVQKQFLSLIISNNFLPDEQSGIVNNSSVLFSNMTEIMTNQINNIFQKLNIPLDLGLNYQPTETGNDIFDVAVSTQLFNNRVIVNGNIGNRQYSNSGGSDVVGDIDIEIKLDRQGALRLNLFSHSADQYTNYLDNSQRSGIGLTFQKEFNRLGQFFRTLFAGKKKKEELQRIEAQAVLNEDKVTFTVSEEDYKKKLKRDARRAERRAKAEDNKREK